MATFHVHFVIFVSIAYLLNRKPWINDRKGGEKLQMQTRVLWFSVSAADGATRQPFVQ